MGRLKKEKQRKTSSLAKWPPTFKFGVFTSGKIKLQEAAINDVVLRVPLKSIKIKKPRGRPPKINHHQLLPSKTAGFKSRVKQIPLKRGKRTNHVPAFHKLQPTNFKHVNKKLTSNKFNWSASKRVYRGPNSPKLDSEQPSGLCKYQSKLTMDFTKLSRLLCDIKLPSPTWKVTVMMNHELRTVFKFTNMIKFVTFTQTYSLCDIIMNDVPVTLLGCPKTIDSMRDLETLLEIVDRLDLKDCMVTSLQYL